MRMKILICDSTANEAIEKMRAEPTIEAVDVKTGMSPEEVIQTIPGYDACMVRSATKIRQNIIDAAKNLKLIVRGGVGLDNIDVAYAEEKGITVRNTPVASCISVAELVFAHALAMSRHVVTATTALKEGRWTKKQCKGVELFGKTIGIIGLGCIGKEVACRAVGFGMKPVAYDPYINDTVVDYKDVSIPVLKSVDELFGMADFITIHVPLTQETRYIIDRDGIAKMKDCVRIINCGRGGTVNESAVLEGIESGKIASAALDVMEEEPATDNALIKSSDKVIGTPHVGASTSEATFRVGMEVADIMIAFARQLAGQMEVGA